MSEADPEGAARPAEDDPAAAARRLSTLRSGNRYQQIADASGIANPDLIHPGQVRTIP